MEVSLNSGPVTCSQSARLGTIFNQLYSLLQSELPSHKVLKLTYLNNDGLLNMIQETAILFPLKFDILAITETYLIITSVPSKILHHGAHNPGISNHHLIYAVISLRRFSQHSVFVRAGTPGPLLSYFNFCPSYFHAQFVLKLLWRLWSADNFKFERKLR